MEALCRIKSDGATAFFSMVELLVARSVLVTERLFLLWLLLTVSVEAAPVSEEVKAIFGMIRRGKHEAVLENKDDDYSDVNDDEDENDEDGDDPEDDGGDDDFSGEENDNEGDGEDGPEAKGGGSEEEDADDDDNDDDEEEEDDEDEEEEDDEEDEELQQPPTKKRK
ncbi:nucleolin-like isoform X2 [Zingiber officinale]|uniref:nucleolin-like isoform X2 n=1 Tax=Zingiber officinale TaxID=94328 RepID=UPI001C4C3A02|nr:nucleolin-like isoform X2 [Zingiber officinale]